MMAYIILVLIVLPVTWVAGWRIMPRLKRRYLDRIPYALRTLGRRNVHGLADEPGAWYTQRAPILWAHAGFGGAQLKYMNSREAVANAIDAGFAVIEVDVGQTSDGVLVLTHNFRSNGDFMFNETPSWTRFRGTELQGGQHPISLDELLSEHRDDHVVFSIDPCHLEGENDLVDYLVAHASESFLKRVVYQVYSISELRRFRSRMPFASLHFTLPEDVFRDCGWKVPYLMEILQGEKVRSVSIGDRPIDGMTRNIVTQFIAANIRVSVVGVNTVERCREWMDVGVTCFNTDRLRPADFDMKRGEQ